MNIPLQPVSIDIWSKKYQLKDKHNNPIDADVDGTYQRVAKAVAAVEKPHLQKKWEISFLWALRNGAIPAGRIIANAGSKKYRPSTSTINCTVSDTIKDSMISILDNVKAAGLTLKAGCGTGYDFSTLRPKGALVAGAGASTSGPLSFMDIFDSMCKTVSSAGGRRGAQMGTFDISHPDIPPFISAKREDGRLRQFNLSCLITAEFMQAVKQDKDWLLVFPANKQELEDTATTIMYKPWVTTEGYTTNSIEEVACKVYKTIPARSLWNLIMQSNYDFAEPGFILIDKVNEMNNNWFCEYIRATNPCGEQPLPPHGACLLGSINLTIFVIDPFTAKARFDWEKYKKVISIFTRLLDNIVEINGLPLQEQINELVRKRRHGMGFLGLGSTLIMLNMVYGDNDSIQFTGKVAYELAVTGWEQGILLAREKGAAPIMEEEFELTAAIIKQRPQLLQDGYIQGDMVQGNILIAQYSNYMKQLPHHIRNGIVEYGCRFTHHSSIAPTGTISLSLANNASNGIEPSFSHKYSRNIIQEGRKTKEKVDVLSYELLSYRANVNQDASPEAEERSSNQLPSNFVDANTISPKAHIDIQAAAQKWVDSSISKTINVPTDYPFEAFKEIYLYAFEKGLKGCTTFRFNPEAFQGVLVQDKDLAATNYRFTLDDGEIIEATGEEEIEYDGETHTAANLYDALKEGYYGKL